MERELVGVMATPDGYWRVEQHHYGRATWFRIWHATTWFDVPTIERVADVLGEQFVELAPIDDAA